MRDRLAMTLAVMVPLTALPLASNRSAWWLIWTALFATLALLFLIRSGGTRPRILVHRRAFGLVLLLPFWALVQSLPIAGFMPPSLIRMAPGLDWAVGPALSVQPDAALVGVLRFMGYVILIALVIEVASRRDRVLRMAQIVYTGVCLQAVWSLVALQLLDDVALWGPKTAYLGSATGTFVNRNSLATFLGFGVVLGLGLLAERAARGDIGSTRSTSWIGQLRLSDLLIVVGLVFLFLALIATQSRLGLAAGVTGFLATLALLRWRSGVSAVRVGLELGALATVAVAVVFLVAAGGGVAERFLFISNEAVNRAAIYQQTMQLIALRPLTGFGMDAFASAFEAVRAPPLLSPVTYDLAHNTYLTLWVEFGLVFGTVPMLVLVLVARILWQRIGAENGFPGLAMAGLGALTIGAIHSLGDFSLEIPANVYLLMLILGLGLGQRSRQGSTQAKAPSRHGRAAA